MSYVRLGLYAFVSTHTSSTLLNFSNDFTVTLFSGRDWQWQFTTVMGSI